MDSPRDLEGHETHTASTIVDGFVERASYFDYGIDMAKGMAPKALIAIYKVVWNQRIYSSDVLKVIEQAIEDKVNILSISLGFTLDDDGFLKGASNFSYGTGMAKGMKPKTWIVIYKVV